MNKSRRISKALMNLKTQVCISFDNNDYKRCISLLNRVKVLEAYLVRLNTTNFFKKAS